MIIFAPVRRGHCSCCKALLDLLLALDGPDGRALCKGTVRASNLHYSASPKQTEPHFLTASACLDSYPSLDSALLWIKSRANSKVFTSLEIISNWLKTAEPDNWIQTRGIQQEGGAFKNRLKLKLSSAKPGVIRVRVQAGVKPVQQWGVLQTVVVVHEGPGTERREALFTGRNAVSTGRLGRMELDEFIKGSAVSPSCHLSPCSQTPINGRNTSKTTFSTRPRKQGCI